MQGLETSVVGGAPTEAAVDAAAAVAALAPSAVARGVAASGEAASIGLWQNRDFKIVLLGQSISALGDAVTFTALPLLVVLLTGSGVAMGSVGVLQTLPDLVLGLPAGAIADRWDRRRMMLWSDVGRAALTATIPLSVLFGLPTMGVVLLVTAPINALRVLFMAAYTAAMPNLAGRDQVGRANGYSEAIFSLSFIVGPAIAGVLVGIIGAAPTLAIDAVSFVVSAVIADARAATPPGSARAGPDAHRGSDPRGASVHQEREDAPDRHRVLGIRQRDRRAGRAGPDLLPEPSTGTSCRASWALVISGYGVGYLLGAVLAGRFSRGRLGIFMLGANIGSSLFLLALRARRFPIAAGVLRVRRRRHRRARAHQLHHASSDDPTRRVARPGRLDGAHHLAGPLADRHLQRRRPARRRRRARARCC